MCRRTDPCCGSRRVGSFALTDERGQPSPTPRCTATSPRQLPVHALRHDLPGDHDEDGALQEKTFDAGARIKLASLSVDPGYDTPGASPSTRSGYHATGALAVRHGPVDDMRRLVEGPLMESMANEGVTVGRARFLAPGYFSDRRQRRTSRHL